MEHAAYDVNVVLGRKLELIKLLFPPCPVFSAVPSHTTPKGA